MSLSYLLEVGQSATATPLASTNIEIGFTDVVLLALVVFLANVAFKLLEKSLDWIIGVSRQEKHDTAPQEEEK
jgi:hypothetical protein